MGQRQRGHRKMLASDAAMNDEASFDSLFCFDITTDTKLAILQENLVTLETKAMQAAEKFLPAPIFAKIKKLA